MIKHLSESQLSEVIVKVNLYLILLESLEAPQGALKVSEIPVRDALA